MSFWQNRAKDLVHVCNGFGKKKNPAPRSLVLGGGEGVGDLFAAIEWRDQDEQSAARNNQAEGAGVLVAFVICTKAVVSVRIATAPLGKDKGLPRMTSFTSSNTRFMS